MSNETKAVDLAARIFEMLTLGYEPDVELVEEAESIGVSVEAIRQKVDELYPTELQDDEELDFN